MPTTVIRTFILVSVFLFGSLSHAIDGGRSEIIDLSVRDVCYSYISPQSKDRCEAIKTCIPLGEKALRAEILKVSGESTSSRTAAQTLALSALHERLGELYAFEEASLHLAIKTMSEAHKLATIAKDDPAISRTLSRLGLLQLRLGEVTNCLGNHNRDSCVFPLTENARHKDKAGSTAAIESFNAYLVRHPDSYHAKWLLNVAHMTLGTFPSGVPKKHRLPLERVRGVEKEKMMTELSIPLGLDRRGRAGGAYVDDLNEDGFSDIVFSDRDDCAPTLLFLSNKNGGFTDATKGSGLEEQKGVTAIFPTDFDNDGKLDLYLTRGAWDRVDSNPFYKIPVFNALLKNLGGGKFKDVTKEVGLLEGRSTAVSANWADYDSNGWADVFVCNESYGVELYLNQKGKFINHTAPSGINTKGFMCKSSTHTDVNGDGKQDLFLSLLHLDASRPGLTGKGAPNRLYLNLGGGKFKLAETPVTLTMANPALSYPSLFFDYDRDGIDDLYVGSFNWPNFESVARGFFGLKNNGDKSALFKGRSDGSFEDVSRKSGIAIADTAMAAAVGDLRNSGYQDLFVGSGGVSLGDVAPNALYQNENGKKFTDISVSQRVGSLQKGHGISFADVNNDGALDVFVRNGSGFPSDVGFPQFFVNDRVRGNWLKISLEGKTANRAALGARVRAYVGKDIIQRTVGAGASFGSNSIVVHLGLGKLSSIEKLEIRWPTPDSTKAIQIFQNVQANQFLKITEGQDTFEVLNRAAFKLQPSSEGNSHQHAH
ncbi:MAG: CRTAC1 family protein [Bdellovibrionales bacterium]|jgi:hypothetical protein|nr:CRTAC1 family protein [Bdellovibrionales bacterium]